MIRCTLDLEKNELVLEMQPPFQEPVYAKTSVCIVPDPCPGCGQCRLCDSKCTCNPEMRNNVQENLEQAV